MRPNSFEDYNSFIKRCTHEFHETRKMYQKMGVKEVSFLVSVDRMMDGVILDYSDQIERYFDNLYDGIAARIEDTGSIDGWEMFVTRNELERILTSLYQEIGRATDDMYSSHYNGFPLSQGESAALMSAYLLTRLAQLGTSTFTEATISRVRTQIDPKKSVEDIAKGIRGIDSAPRARVIAETETGVAKSIMEAETMRKISQETPLLKYWVGTMDDKIRDSHLGTAQFYNRLNPIPFNESFNVGGSLMRYPRDSNGDPKEVVNCRCHLGYIKR